MKLKTFVSLLRTSIFYTENYLVNNFYEIVKLVKSKFKQVAFEFTTITLSTYTYKHFNMDFEIN